MTQMQGLILYHEYLETFEKLPAEDFKNLMMNAMRYNQGLEIGELTPMAELIWPLISSKIDHSIQAYDKRCEINRKNAEKR